MNKKWDYYKTFWFFLFSLVSFNLQADIIDSLRNKLKEEQQIFRTIAKKDINEFRKRANMEYAEQLRNPWSPFPDGWKIKPPVIPEPPSPPILEDEDKVPIDKVLPIDTIVLTPVPEPQPKPVYPIEEDPFVKLPDVNITFYGTPLKVAGANFKDFRLKSNDENAIADGWEKLLNKDNDNFILDCLKLRDSLALPDWGYFKMTDKMLSNYASPGTDTHTLLMAYVLIQSGYSIRICKASDNKLHLLFGYEGILYDRFCIIIDGKKLYAYDQIPAGGIYMKSAKQDGEKDFSMAIRKSPLFNYHPGNNRIVEVKNHPELKLKCQPNKNLINFFNDYPSGTLDSSPYSKWAIHGNTPMSKELSEALYPTLKDAVRGMTQSEAVNLLLKVAQSFEYGLDDEIWGQDRPFWTEESWHYPLSDCEDHAVNFTRLVRDVLGLDAVLIYYPGHLSSGIAITDGSQKGDYVVYNGKKYTVCDATYFYAPAGLTAPGNDNSKSILIPLHQ